MVSVVWMFHSSGYVMVVLEPDKRESPVLPHLYVVRIPQSSISFSSACIQN